MAVRTHPRPGRTAAAQSRLPWWALVLPVVAFTALFSLPAGQADARAASGTPSSSISRVLERIHEMLDRQLP